MALTDDLDRLERRMQELKEEAVRLTEELERLGQHAPPTPVQGPLIAADPAVTQTPASADGEAA